MPIHPSQNRNGWRRNEKESSGYKRPHESWELRCLRNGAVDTEARRLYVFIDELCLYPLFRSLNNALQAT
jgi:hypothetical protein